MRQPVRALLEANIRRISERKGLHYMFFLFCSVMMLAFRFNDEYIYVQDKIHNKC